MKIPLRPPIVFAAVLALLSIFLMRDAGSIPFHPDESTQLFTSGDAERFWQNPAALFWQPDKEADLMQRYRLLDAPLARNVIALGRWIAGEPPLSTDWDWSKTWEENLRLGAMPTRGQLLAGRLATTALLPFSILLLYLTGRRIGGEFTGWAAALLLASNALILLHARRSMAEGALVFATALFMWSLSRAEKRPWLAGIPAALAFAAKQLLAPLAAVGALAALWPDPLSISTPGWRRRSLLLYGGLFLAVVLLLHPFLWGHPLPAGLAALKARQELSGAQVADRPAQALDTPGKRLGSLVGSLYLTAPLFAETGNYTEQTRAAEAAYLSNPLHSLFRGAIPGALLLVLDLFGFIIALLTALHSDPRTRRRLALLLAASAAQTAALLALVPLPWQRYYMPLVPFSCLWIGFALNRLSLPAANRLAGRVQRIAQRIPQERESN